MAAAIALPQRLEPALHMAHMVTLLGNSQSTSDGVRKPAENALLRCECVQGFCVTLLHVIVDRANVDTALRTLAAISIKNTVARHWKARGGRGGGFSRVSVQLSAGAGAGAGAGPASGPAARVARRRRSLIQTRWSDAARTGAKPLAASSASAGP